MNHSAVHLKLTQHCKSTILQLKREKIGTWVKRLLKKVIVHLSCAGQTIEHNQIREVQRPCDVLGNKWLSMARAYGWGGGSEYQKVRKRESLDQGMKTLECPIKKSGLDLESPSKGTKHVKMCDKRSRCCLYKDGPSMSRQLER